MKLTNEKIASPVGANGVNFALRGYRTRPLGLAGARWAFLFDRRFHAACELLHVPPVARSSASHLRLPDYGRLLFDSDYVSLFCKEAAGFAVPVDVSDVWGLY